VYRGHPLVALRRGLRSIGMGGVPDMQKPGSTPWPRPRIRRQPVGQLDPERVGQLAAIGLVKGQPFAPDDRLRGIHDNHDRERFLTRLPAIPPGPVADVLLPVEFAKSCSPRSRGLRMPDQSIHPAANQDTWPAPAP
jgi:hypothetical protein